MELLSTGRDDELALLAASTPRALRPLSGRLWDDDPEIRARAARAIAVLAEAHPRLGREFVRRSLWGLSDESATNGVYAIQALGEIARRVPEVMAPFIEPLRSMAWDEGLRSEIDRALSHLKYDEGSETK